MEPPLGKNKRLSTFLFLSKKPDYPEDTETVHKLTIRNEKGNITKETEGIKEKISGPTIKAKLNKSGKSGWNEQFSTHILGTKVKWCWDKPSKQSHNG